MKILLLFLLLFSGACNTGNTPRSEQPLEALATPVNLPEESIADKPAADKTVRDTVVPGGPKINFPEPSIHVKQSDISKDYLVYFTAKQENGKNKQLDVRKVNPYLSLPYPQFWISADSMEISYDLHHLTEAEKTKLLSGVRINEKAYRAGDYLALVTDSPIVSIAWDKAIVSYHRSFYSSDEEVLATQGVAIVYDTLGNEIRRIKDDKDGFFQTELSQDGKYFMQQYGFIYGEDGGGQLETGFKFYDANTGEKIGELDFGRDPFIVSQNFFPEHSQFFIIDRWEPEFIKIYLIHFTSSEYYQMVVNRQKYLNNPEYRKTLILLDFIKSGNPQDLIEIGYKKYSFPFKLN